MPRLIPGRKGKNARGAERAEVARSKLPLFNRLAGIRHIDEAAGAVVD